MLEIKSYLGFTDNIKEPRKTKIENTLDHLYRYHGEVMSAVSFLCTKLLEGCCPDWSGKIIGEVVTFWKNGILNAKYVSR